MVDTLPDRRKREKDRRQSHTMFIDPALDRRKKVRRKRPGQGLSKQEKKQIEINKKEFRKTAWASIWLLLAVAFFLKLGVDFWVEVIQPWVF
jgi:hypothetical protein